MKMMPLSKKEAQHIQQLSDIDWTSWTPVDIATLLFVMLDDRVLLIRKLTGLGKGKINAPGGRVEKGESIEAAAVREVQEELCITPIDPVYRGENLFQFTDGYSLHIHVFTATQYQGTPEETVEAIPLWFPVDAFPYEQMWEDDRLWIPLMLNEQQFIGRYIFRSDDMLDYNLQLVDR